LVQLYVGTCSWKFPSWRGLVYSADKGIDYLQEYARQYNTVEIDQWFWSRFGLGEVSLPRPDDAAAYRSVVSDGFRFTVKAPNSVTLTHLYRKNKSDPLVANPSFLMPMLMRAFLRAIEPLRDALGPVMCQFEYLNRQKMPSQRRFQEQFAAFVDQAPAGYPYALEVRNAQYMNVDYFAFLNHSGVIPVLLQGYWMPPVWAIYDRHRALILEQETIVIRLLGPDREGIEAQTGKVWNKVVAPKDEELPEIVRVVNDLLDEGVEVYVNVNNHYEGSAPLTIARIQELL
jgi:uncharacterized protein YecE (DUF72 family)